MAFMPKVFINLHNWYPSTIDSLKSANFASLDNHQSSPSLLYNYDHAVHGFAAHLSKHELEALKKSPGFVSASEDRTSTLHTTHTPEFLSLHSTSGLWLASNQGKDVIIGVIDTGIWPESKTFKDDGTSKKIPDKWKGTCEEGQDFNSSMCNAKLIGARSFYKGLIANEPNFRIRMKSTRDMEGHGTLISSIVAGNYVEGTSFFGYATGTASGVASHARLAIYKVFWDKSNYISDFVAAIDQAIADSVDVISASLEFRLYQ